MIEMRSLELGGRSHKNAEGKGVSPVKGSVPIVDTILCHAASVRQKSGGIKINLGDWRWQLAVGRGGYKGVSPIFIPD